jgi:hypothetical protein
MSGELTPHTYVGYRLLPAALGLLDIDNDPRFARAVDVFPSADSDAGYGATIDWAALATLRLPSSARSALTWHGLCSRATRSTSRASRASPPTPTG